MFIAVRFRGSKVLLRIDPIDTYGCGSPKSTILTDCGIRAASSEGGLVPASKHPHFFMRAPVTPSYSNDKRFGRPVSLKKSLQRTYCLEFAY